MPFYSVERKAALLKMMLAPLSLSASEVASQERTATAAVGSLD